MKQADLVKNLQIELVKKDERFTSLESDKVRFKTLSDNYMQEVSRLESQLEMATETNPSKMTSI